MGLETALIVGFTALQAVGSIQQSKAQAKAVVQQANINMQNKAKETMLKAARVQSSFLTSGLTLEGTPMAVIEDTFNTGLQDLNQIRSNANTEAKNIISAGRSEALGKLASGFSGMDFGSMASSGSFNSITSNLPVGKYGGGFGYYGDAGRIDWYR